MYDPTFDDYFDPPESTGPLMRCTNRKCPEGEFQATTIKEWQGDRPHGGMVEFIDDADCPTCGAEGVEV